MACAGSAVMEALAAAGIHKPVLQLGLPDVFTEYGDPAKLMALQGWTLPVFWIQWKNASHPS